MTLQELKDKLNDQNLIIEYSMSCKMPSGKNNPFPRIITKYKIKTKVKLLTKSSVHTFSVTKDTMEMQGFDDINSFLLYSDKTRIINSILEGIGYHYEYSQKN